MQNNNYKILKAKQTNYTAVELFSGCGGMALGLEHAGFQTKLVSEIDKYACATLKLNRPNWQLLEGDIHKFNSENHFDQYKNLIDVVAGGFPCQAFSYAGNNKGFGDPRGTLFFEFVKTIKAVQPKIALGENVKGLLQHDYGRTLKTMIQLLEGAGYKVAFRLVRSQFLDVPQKRERIFIIGIRSDLNIHHIFPEEKSYTINLNKAFENIPKSVGYKYSLKKEQIMKLVPEGGNWRNLPIDIQKEYMQKSFYSGGGKTGIARRLSRNQPLLTLMCSPAQKQTERCHPVETRPLNIREYARIQTFPDEWTFEGSICQQYKQIGNAVPVNLAYHIGRCLIKMLDETNKDK